MMDLQCRESFKVDYSARGAAGKEPARRFVEAAVNPLGSCGTRMPR